jgi:hypothetical protein
LIAQTDRYARPFLLVDAALLLGGVLLTSFNLLLLGWSVYAVGHLGLIVGLVLFGMRNRDRLDGWAWAALGVLIVGLVLALPGLLSIWQGYVTTPTRGQMVVPSEAAPIGRFADLVTWVGAGFFGLAARGVRVLPAGAGWILVVAAVIGLVADLGLFPALVPVLWWVPAMLVFILGLVAIGGSLGLAQRLSGEVVAR